MATNFKAPPLLSKASSYEVWLKEIQIWEAFTDLKKVKRGPAIFLTLEDKAREAILELEVDNISSEDGVKNITNKLDQLYLKDKTQSLYEAYDKFERFKRPDDMSIGEYINEFERLKCKTETYGTSLSTDVLAYRVLKSANLSQHHEQLARATISELTYEDMKKQLKKIFGDSSKDFGGVDTSIVKIESIMESTEDSEIFYGNNNYKNRRASDWRGRGRVAARGFNRGSRQESSAQASSASKLRGKNPLINGVVSRCSICDSINHWAANCPDATYYGQGQSDEEIDHHVTLFQSNLILEEQLKVFVSESFNAAILDSGATGNVTGEVWLKCYMDSLSDRDREAISYSDSCSSFKFGSEDIYKSLYKVKVPAQIGTKRVFIETDVITTDIPMLLSKKAMKKAQTEINFKNDTISMFGERQKVVITNSGHYGIPLDRKNEVLNDAATNSANIILHLVDVQVGDKKRMARKLHSQFAHPSADRLIKLISAAGRGNDRQLIHEIKSLSESCEICQVYKKPPNRPVVGMPLATEFNQVVAMDLKMFEGKWILHLIDHVSRFSAASFVSSKKPDEIISKIFKCWISVFGPPKKFLSDNGGEFVNSKFLELCESFNIVVLTTAAEAPWSNGLCERHNAVLGEMMTRVCAEKRCDKDMALCWAIHAKNSLANIHGFTPYQLAIGSNPSLPGILEDEAPALNTPVNQVVLDNLNTIAATRKAFIEADSNMRLKRALSHNIRSSGGKKFVTGDKVFYKRADTKNWKGPGVVIGQDSQQVLIKHGGVYVKVHPCRVMLRKDSFEVKDKVRSAIVAEASSRTMKSKSGTSEDEDFDTESTAKEAIVGGHLEESDSDTEALLYPHKDIAGPISNVCSSNSEDHALEETVDTVESCIPSSSIVKEKVKKGMDIEILPSDKECWKKVSVLNRTGKATGKYKNHWNVTDGTSTTELDLDAVSWRISQDVQNNDGGNASDEINLNMVF